MLGLTAGRLKTFTLIMLITLSLILSGSLWFEDYHGFSAFFARIGDMTFSRIINIGKDGFQSKYEKIFSPSEIIINDGDGGHWILYPSEQVSDEVWKTAKTLLKDIAATAKGLNSNVVEKQEWDGLLTKRSVLVSFGYPLNEDIVSILIKADDNKINEAAVNISEMSIIRLGENVILYTKKKRNNKDVYQKFYFSNSQFFSDKYLEQIFNDDRLIRYHSLKEALPDAGPDLTFNDRVIAPITSHSNQRKKTVSLKKVDFVPEITIDEGEEIDNLVNKFFQGADYAKFIKNDGTHIFIDERNNTLKIYSDGMVEFELREDSILNREDAGFESALRTTLTTTEKYGGIGSLYLTGMSIEKGEYVFQFNYTVEGIPVVCSRMNENPPVNGAVEVMIGNGLIRYKRLLSEPKALEEEYRFLSNHDSISIINSIVENVGSNKSNIHIEDIRLVYRVAEGGGTTLYPVWLVKYQVDGRKAWKTIDAAKDRS